MNPLITLPIPTTAIGAQMTVMNFQVARSSESVLRRFTAVTS
ncbi:hypothetical protein [Streptomonospora litoralis]|nr:hypothetical protein [Streptomonospora litoralis]